LVGLGITLLVMAALITGALWGEVAAEGGENNGTR
jgi:hypothetical protein